MDRLRRLETFARAGWFARGVVYLLLAYLAFATGTRDEGTVGVLRYVQTMPAGGILLTLLAVGLCFYGIYRLHCALFDGEGKGGDAKALAIRTGYAGSALAHLALAWLALKLLNGRSQEGGETEKGVARFILELPFGGTLLGILGAAFLLAALHQARKAWTASFMADIDPRAPSWVCPVGQAGTAARAVVFAIVGYSLLSAGWFAQAHHVKGLDDALSALRGQPLIYAFVILGLAMFGLLSLVETRWRRIRNEDVVARFKAAIR